MSGSVINLVLAPTDVMMVTVAVNIKLWELTWPDSTVFLWNNVIKWQERLFKYHTWKWWHQASCQACLATQLSSSTAVLNTAQWCSTDTPARCATSWPQLATSIMFHCMVDSEVSSIVWWNDFMEKHLNQIILKSYLKSLLQSFDHQHISSGSEAQGYFSMKTQQRHENFLLEKPLLNTAAAAAASLTPQAPLRLFSTVMQGTQQV